MSLLVFYFFTVYLLAVGSVVAVGFSIQKTKEKNYLKPSTRISSTQISVLIPFRNEATRISVLLDSIAGLSKYPQEFVFIDDHSNDSSVELIREKLVDAPVRILHLPEGKSGKKEALRYGIEQSNSRYILTWDADIEVCSDYFSSLENLEEADIYVLPAVLEGKNVCQRFYEMDVVLANAVNAGLAGLRRPIFASGANLLYRRDSYEQVENFESHKHIASGDDTYLLRDFRLAGKDVRLVSAATFAVRTETPQSFREFINQRLRWIGKTGNLKDQLATCTSIFQFVLSLGYVGLLIIGLAKGNWDLFWMIYLLKCLLDFGLFAPYFHRIERLGSALLLPIYELLFPVYNLLLLVLLLVYKPKWKGRAIYTKKGPA